jgi:xanthine dehydrogenase YagS FAD-binding subunit
MNPFEYHRAADANAAAAAAGSAMRSDDVAVRRQAQFIAGGTNMVDYMRLDVVRPQRLIDINHLDPARYGRIESSADGLRIGALTRMAQAEDHPTIKAEYPLLFDTLQLAASRQIRNMATLGGNVLQRTRCAYFRETSWQCNKRNPGSGCAALQGMNREHAILGASDACIAAYPGDFAQALIALDATLETFSPRGTRTFEFARLHRLPGATPHIETSLEPDELIAFIHVPSGPWTRRSRYVKVRDRQSYQFALASAAVALDMDGPTVRSARIALGGVATVPWRAREAEAALTGKVLNERSATGAAEQAFANAQVRLDNAFKVTLGQQTLIRALFEARDMQV